MQRDVRQSFSFGLKAQDGRARLGEMATPRGRIRTPAFMPVGTTSLRLLESAAKEDGTIQPFSGDTAIFITPGYRFRAVDILLTNFHLPRSTLFMLVAAFSGLDLMKRAYAHAVGERYRFYSYGDACLLNPAPEVEDENKGKVVSPFRMRRGLQ